MLCYIKKQIMKLSIKKKNHVFIFLFWIILSISVWAQDIRPGAPWPSILPNVILISVFIIVSHYLSDNLLPKALKSRNMKLFGIQSVLCVLFLSLILALVFTFLPNDSNELLSFRKEYINNPLRFFLVQYYSAIPSSIAILTTTCGIRFYQEHNQIEKDHNKLKKEHLEAQLKLLQDQINPHLMFNILNHIHILMQSNVELASTLLIKFSDILRYQLYECNHKVVFLHREIKYLQDLVAVEKIRWGDELKVDCEWIIKNGQLQIAPLLLVPLVENSFKHVSRLPESIGYIKIFCKENQGTLTLSIENSYSTKYKLPAKESSGIGLKNVKERLKMLYPNQHAISIEQTENYYNLLLTIKL